MTTGEARDLTDRIRRARAELRAALLAAGRTPAEADMAIAGLTSQVGSRESGTPAAPRGPRWN